MLNVIFALRPVNLVEANRDLFYLFILLGILILIFHSISPKLLGIMAPQGKLHVLCGYKHVSLPFQGSE